MTQFGLPAKEGLYDPAQEHDACGIGFVADLRRGPSHDIVSMGVDILCRLTHRGAAGADEHTGDGAGLLLQTPDRFLRRVADESGFGLPGEGAYASALVFLSTDAKERAWQKELLTSLVVAEGQSLIGWRDVPTDPDKIGETARMGMPAIEQVFIGAAEGLDADAFDRKLYVIRRLCEKQMIERGLLFHVPSLSSKTLLYKGMFLAHQAPNSSSTSEPMTWNRALRWFTSATAPIPFPPGISLSPSATSPITGRSIRWRAMPTGCTPGREPWSRT